MTSQISKLTLSFLSRHFSTWPKRQDKNLNNLRTKRVFKMKQKAFCVTFKWVLVAKNCLRPGRAPLISGNRNYKTSFYCIYWFKSLVKTFLLWLAISYIWPHKWLASGNKAISKKISATCFDNKTSFIGLAIDSIILPFYLRMSLVFGFFNH